MKMNAKMPIQPSHSRNNPNNKSTFLSVMNRCRLPEMVECFTRTGRRVLMVFFSIFGLGSTEAAIIQFDDLNIIEDAGNASDGFSFLDITFSKGRTLPEALSEAQVKYPDARVATASEFNDLFAAGGIMFNGALTAADAFTPGGFAEISSGTNYHTYLRDALGFTGTIDGDPATLIFTDPDGSSLPESTRDYIGLGEAKSFLYASSLTPPLSQWGWLLVSESAANEAPVFFADPNLKTAVENALGVTEPTLIDMLALSHLTVSASGIMDLTGLETATNLTFLNLDRNQISGISGLSGLTSLRHLDLGSNLISDISALSGLTDLDFLRLTTNQIGDIPDLSGLTNLTFLGLAGNEISEVSASWALSSLISLTDLRLDHNQIIDVSGLTGLTNLTKLTLDLNEISNEPEALRPRIQPDQRHLCLVGSDRPGFPEANNQPDQQPP
jgi:hypothetical protein